MVAFTTNLVTTEVGVDPVSGNVWYYTGGISGSMVNIGTAPISPINTVAPAVTGNIAHGNALTSTNGTWNVSGTYTYQWYRSGTLISGATASTYTTTVPDVGSMITCVVTNTASTGSNSATSNAVGPIT